MDVRLQSFRYRPRGRDGWGTRLLHFGQLFTAVQGPNGSGKTPIMKGVAQALGHEVELPPEVLERCECAEITLSVEGRSVILTRSLAQNFELSVDDGSKRESFTNQKDYAKWFMGLFNAESLELTTKQHQPAGLYASVVLPALSVDQDHGWTTDYWTPPNRNFILDQRQEVIRYLVGLTARHPFQRRTEFEKAKQNLDRTQKALELQRFVIDRLRTNEEIDEAEEPRLLSRRSELQLELTENQSAIEAIRSATAHFDREIDGMEEERGRLDAHVRSLAKRKGQLSLVLSELDGEEEVLTANVQSSELLRQFCGRDGCQMFATSERSFGRSLLFLKDQVKDLQTSDRELSREVELIKERLDSLRDALMTKRRERESAVNSSPQAEVAAKLTALTKEIVEVELRIAKIQQYRGEQQKFERLLDQREQSSSAVADRRPGRSKSVTSTGDVRQMLSDSVQQWLATLGTQNTRAAHFDNDFILYIDGDKFSTTTHQSGSTRTRIVLAFHAALLEVALARGGNHPGWLLFDAPKQHELSQGDFDAYTDRLSMIAAKYPRRVQVVFSVADLKTQFEAGDEVWAPGFTVNGKHRFLGPVVDEPTP